MSNHCLKNAKPWFLRLETGSLKAEGEMTASSEEIEESVFWLSPQRLAKEGLQVNGSHRQGSPKLLWGKCANTARKRCRKKVKFKHWFFCGVESEPRASQMPGKTFATELHPEPTLFILRQGLIKLTSAWVSQLSACVIQMTEMTGRFMQQKSCFMILKNNTLLYPKPNLKVRKMKECKW